MAIKLYYNKTTYQLIGIDDNSESIVVGDDGGKELQFYFGTGTTLANYVNDATIPLDYLGRAVFERADGASSGEVYLTPVLGTGGGYFKLILTGWFSDVEGNLEITSRLKVSDGAGGYVVTTFSLATLPIEPGVAPTDDTISDAEYQAIMDAVDGVVQGTTDIAYDNTVSELAAETVQEAIDEIDGNVDDIIAGTQPLDKIILTDLEIDKTYVTDKVTRLETAESDIDDLELEKEDVVNKITTWGTPTDVQYPSAKLVKDTTDALDTRLTTAEGEIDVLQSTMSNEQGYIDQFQSDVAEAQSDIIDLETFRDTTVPATYETIVNVALKEDKANKGQAGGYAELDESGKVPLSQTYGTLNDLQDAHVVGSTPYASDWLSLTAGGSALTPESGNWYHVVTVGDYQGESYRWSGSAYVLVSSDLILGETSNTAYRGDRGKTAYDHSQIVNGTNPHATTFANLVNKPTTVDGYGITDVYKKTQTYTQEEIDALLNDLQTTKGLQNTLLTPTELTNGQTIETSQLTTNKTLLMFVATNQDSGEIDSDIVQVSSILAGKKFVFFDNESITFTIGETNSTFVENGNYTLKINALEIASDLSAEQLFYDNTTSEREATNVQEALDETFSEIDAHVGSTSNPHSVTKTQVGLGNVDNTSDTNKYVKGLIETRANTNTQIWTGTQAQYDAIGTPDANTLYFITD